MASEDEARLLASLTAALASARLRVNPDAPYDEKLAQLENSMARQHGWLVPVAQRLSPGLMAWLVHPWYCWRLRTLTRQMEGSRSAPLTEQASALELAKCASMIEFGVCVNSRWYRALRAVVEEGRASRRELRGLLWRSAMHWGVFGTPAAPDASTHAWRGARFCHIGRPPGGELIVAESGRTIRWLLFIVMFVACAAVGLLSGSLTHYFNRYGDSTGLGRPLAVCYVAGVVAWAGWWFGSHRWLATERLHSILRERVKGLERSASS